MSDQPILRPPFVVPTAAPPLPYTVQDLVDTLQDQGNAAWKAAAMAEAECRTLRRRVADLEAQVKLLNGPSAEAA